MFHKVGSFLGSFGGLKYLMFPDSMADHLSKSAREKQIDFCKSFYSLPGKRIIAKFVARNNTGQYLNSGPKIIIAFK